MAVGDSYLFPGFLTPVLTQLFFPKPPTTFLTCFCRGERQNTPERKVASIGDRTHNHQVMSPTRSQLSRSGGERLKTVGGENAGNQLFLFSHSVSSLSFNSFPNKPWFLRVCSTSLLKTLGKKEKLLITSNFSFPLSVFYPFGELFVMFIKIEIFVCKLFQFGRV